MTKTRMHFIYIIYRLKYLTINFVDWSWGKKKYSSQDWCFTDIWLIVCFILVKLFIGVNFCKGIATYIFSECWMILKEK